MKIYRDGNRGITAGSPARSLLYHALASPNVLNDQNGVQLRGFATLAELETVENFVFGIEPPTIAQLLERTGESSLSIVVFSYEYRPAKDTCAKRQADMVFARTGIARVGTATAKYLPERRGFWMEDETDAMAIRVCPSRYAAYLAIKVNGDRTRSLPMRHQGVSQTNPAGDTNLGFWLPVHKLFNGTECLAGLDLTVAFSAFHVNEKIRRIHLALGEVNPPTTPPYRFSENIAEIATDAELGTGVVMPVAHNQLVEPAVANGRFITYDVPRNNGSNFAAFEIPTDTDEYGEIRPAPAYIHARTEIRDNRRFDLNNDKQNPDVRRRVDDGGYHALHYLDFTGEGEITVTCGALVGQDGIDAQPHAAYSLVSAPDFFPSSGQRELTEWTESKEVPTRLKDTIWAVEPHPLCDVRLPANLQLPNGRFDPQEKTITAVLPLWSSAVVTTGPPVRSSSADAIRHSSLPDDAAGIFAPGWDVSHDRLQIAAGNETPHLAAYGLGSPFPEDAKLCAALSTFWPTVAPDSSRIMSPGPNRRLRATIAPLTDEEIGQVGSLPWDGITGPKLVTINGAMFAECQSFLHSDYVKSALENRFSPRLLARIAAEEYQLRVLAMALVYLVLGGNRNTWFLLSFKRTAADNTELQQAEMDAHVILSGPTFRFELFQIDPITPSTPVENNPQRHLIPVNNREYFFVDAQGRKVVHRNDNQRLWRKVPINV